MAIGTDERISEEDPHGHSHPVASEESPGIPVLGTRLGCQNRGPAQRTKSPCSEDALKNETENRQQAGQDREGRQLVVFFGH